MIREAGKSKSRRGGCADLTANAAYRPLTAAHIGKPSLQHESPLRHSGNKRQDKHLTESDVQFFQKHLRRLAAWNKEHSCFQEQMEHFSHPLLWPLGKCDHRTQEIPKI